jgi:hypothetical protein
MVDPNLNRYPAFAGVQLLVCQTIQQLRRNNMNDVLATDRQQSTPLSSVSGQAALPHRGVGGWLLLFCIALTMFSPLITFSSFAWDYGAYSKYFGQFPGLLAITVIDTVLSLALMTFSVYAGIRLWRVRPGAVRLAKRYLLCFLVYRLFAAILPFMAGLPSAANDAMIEQSTMDIFRAVIFFAVWYSYLIKSQRIRATYAV